MFSLDPLRAKKLGFVSISLSGSRAYQYPLREFPTTCDWGFVGVVERKCDILNLVWHRREEICDLIEIDEPERFPWEILEDGKEGSDNNYQEDYWEVIRFSGWASDGSKRSLKLWSEEHIRTIATDPEVCRFGVLSAKVTRYIRSHHPRNGNRIFVYQPLRIAENLPVLDDVDFLAGQDDLTALGAGVTCDLFLSSCTAFERSAGTVGSLKGALMRKWCALANEPDVECFFPLFHGYSGFNTEKLHRLQIELTTKPSSTLADVPWSSSSSSSPAGSPTESQGNGSSVILEFQNDKELEDYSVVSFLPIQEKEKLGSLRHEYPVSTFFIIRGSSNSSQSQKITIPHSLPRIPKARSQRSAYKLQGQSLDGQNGSPSSSIRDHISMTNSSHSLQFRSTSHPTACSNFSRLIMMRRYYFTACLRVKR